MTDIPKQVFEAFLTILGGIIAGCVGLFVGRFQRTREARLQFLSYLSVMIGSMPGGDGVSINNFYFHTFDETRDAVFQVIPFLKESKAEKLLAVWEKYAGLDSEYINQDGYTPA